MGEPVRDYFGRERPQRLVTVPELAANTTIVHDVLPVWRVLEIETCEYPSAIARFVAMVIAVPKSEAVTS